MSKVNVRIMKTIREFRIKTGVNLIEGFTTVSQSSKEPAIAMKTNTKKIHTDITNTDHN